MARKRATLAERIAALQSEIEALEATERVRSTKYTRRTLAGKRAALHVMENVRVDGKEEEYCKSDQP